MSVLFATYCDQFYCNFQPAVELQVLPILPLIMTDTNVIWCLQKRMYNLLQLRETTALVIKVSM